MSAPLPSAALIDRITTWLEDLAAEEDEAAFRAVLPTELREAEAEEQGAFLAEAFQSVEIAAENNLQPLLASFRALGAVDSPASAFFNRKVPTGEVSWRMLLSSCAVPPLKAVPYPPGPPYPPLAVLAVPPGPPPRERRSRR